LRIQENWKSFGASQNWREWEVRPTSRWNYGLVLQRAPEMSFSILRKAGPLSDQPFDPAFVPIELYARARRIPSWKTDTNGLANVLPSSPAQTEEPVETVALIPMGAARLRVTTFPLVNEPEP
jgi:hypothetical protein